MEDIRRRFAGEGLYPVLGKQKPTSTSRHRTPEVIELSSDSEDEIVQPSASRARPPAKSAPRKHPRVIESSDEEEDEEPTQSQSQDATASEEDEDDDEAEYNDDDEVEELVAAPPSNQARGHGTQEPMRASAPSAPAFPVPRPYQPPQGVGAPVPAPVQMPRPEQFGYRPHNVTAGQPQLSQYDAYHAKYAQPTPALPGYPKPPVPLAKPSGYPQDAKPRPPSNFVASVPKPQHQFFEEPSSHNVPNPDGGQDFGHLLNVDHIREDFVTQDEAQKQVLELVASTVHHDDVEINPEDAIVDGFAEGIKLLPHQVVGRKFMAARESGKGKLGGILADDMGLGKTIQTLTRIVDNKPSREDRETWSRATLVVCPASLVSQWAEEIKQKTVGLKVLEHQGAGRPRDPKVFNTYHVVVTTYQTLASEYSNSLGGGDGDDDEEGGTKSKGKSKAKAKQKQKNADRGEDSDEEFSKYLQKSKDAKAAKGKAKAKPKHEALFNTNWWRVVLDEAHNIKNRSSKQSLACWHLDAKYRWALTGTPIQNDVEDLFAIFRFLRCRPLHEWPTFKEIIVTPIKGGRTKRAMARIHTILRAIMLRRTKATEMGGKRIIELPDRNVQQVTCEFDDGERAFYRSLEDKTAKIFEDMEKMGAVMKNYTSVLVMLLRLRQTCDHPVLVSKDYTGDLADSFADGGKKDDADALAEVFGDLHVGSNKCSVCQTELGSSDRGTTCSDCSLILAMEKRRQSGGAVSRTNGSADAGPSSAKLRKMLELLQQIDDESEGGDKTIIFSQFTGMLDLVGNFLKAEGIRFTRFDGTMSKEQKAAAVEKIKESRSTKVILISLKAGGVGLNLTACNRVILLDPWWNPAIEEQAFDRAHRFGQKKTVEVYKLTVENTVEQRIIEMQDKKRELAAAALSGQKVNANKLTLSDLRKLFSRQHDHEDSEDE